ncbi:Mlr3822 protein [hydrothermal vent metagenome]|uniref:Mlr3822 protein n=1 Tax=hydrothermal vent metagenome TaxID=652676 RepID=A0A3B0T2I6_9ZZZZ
MQDIDDRAGAAVTSFEAIAGDPGAGYLLLCDHASNDLPPEYGRLGLPDGEMERHIAYDIGARAVTMELARQLGAPALLTRFSRLLIDPNRGADDPTLVMRIADGAVVPGNAAIDDDEIATRRQRYHAPYHGAIDAAIANAVGAGVPPALFSVHSFTPVFKGKSRPWHATVLWDNDPRLPLPLLRALEAEGDLVIGENVPYSGKLEGDTLYTHGTGPGLANALIEIRQDLIADPAQARAWGQRLARILGPIARSADLNEMRKSPAVV